MNFYVFLIVHTANTKIKIIEIESVFLLKVDNKNIC